MTLDELRYYADGKRADVPADAIHWAADEIERLASNLNIANETCRDWGDRAIRAETDADSARQRITELEETVLSSGQFRVGGLGP